MLNEINSPPERLTLSIPEAATMTRQSYRWGGAVVVVVLLAWAFTVALVVPR